MHSKNWFLFLVFSVLLSVFVYGRVICEVLPAVDQYQEGCDPVILTTSGETQNGDEVSLTINVENRETPYLPDALCEENWSSELTDIEIDNLDSDPACPGCFTLTEPGPFDIPINTDLDYEISVTIESGAAPGTYTLEFRVASSIEGWDYRYVELSGIEVTGALGCTENSDCDETPETPYCETNSGTCVACLQASHCNDTNECTTDSCDSNVCNNAAVDDGDACTDGFCCSGSCDTSTGNDNFHADCRSGPACNGGSWEYSIANDTLLCGGFECRECNAGYCDYDEDTRCGSGESCVEGTCAASGCINDSGCSGTTPYCETGSGICVACLGDSDCDDDNDCTDDSCTSSNACEYDDENDGSECDSCGEDNCECDEGVCECAPDCEDRECGDDGCEGTCGSCSSYIGDDFCYDSGDCDDGNCSFDWNSISEHDDCCEYEFVIDDDECTEEGSPSDSNCEEDEYCTSSCTCETGICGTYFSESSCEEVENCDWCPLNAFCIPEEEIECTDTDICYTGNKICSTVCKLNSCPGTSRSCGCEDGACKRCGSGEICDDFECSASDCTPDWVCEEWTVCSETYSQTRTCTENNDCNADEPETERTCTLGTGDIDGDSENSLNDSSQNLTGNQSTNNDEEDLSTGSFEFFSWTKIIIVFAVILCGGAAYYFFIMKSPASIEQKKVENFVKMRREKNQTEDQIRSTLIKEGWSLFVVERALRKFRK